MFFNFFQLFKPQPVVWRENQPPEGEITTLVAKDNDSPENGPPFTFSISRKASEDIKRKFDVRGKFCTIQGYSLVPIAMVTKLK